MLLMIAAFWTGFLARPPLTPTQTLASFFEAWETGDRTRAQAILLRPERLWDNFERDVRSLHLVKIDRPDQAVVREAEYRQRHSDLPWLSRVIILRATFDVQFHQEGSMTNGRNVYSFYLVREWPWSPWLISDWTSQP